MNDQDRDQEGDRQGALVGIDEDDRRPGESVARNVGHGLDVGLLGYGLVSS